MGEEFEIISGQTVQRLPCKKFEIITKQDIDASPFKKHMINNDKIMFLILVGSSTSGIYDNYSDIDLCKVVDEEPSAEKVKNKYYGHWNNIHTHLTTLAYNGKYTNIYGIKTIQELSFGLGPGSLEDKYCLYLNPKYAAEYEDLKTKMKARQYYAAIHCLYALKGLYEPENFVKSKFGLQCLYSKAIINKEQIDKEYLLALKRSRYIQVPQEYLDRLEEDKKGLRAYGSTLTEEKVEQLGAKNFQIE